MTYLRGRYEVSQRRACRVVRATRSLLYLYDPEVRQLLTHRHVETLDDSRAASRARKSPGTNRSRSKTSFTNEPDCAAGDTRAMSRTTADKTPRRGPPDVITEAVLHGDTCFESFGPPTLTTIHQPDVRLFCLPP